MMTISTVTHPDDTKRDAILHASVGVFAGEGFRGADVQRIADEAGVGKGTVYRYFGDKQELFWATVLWVLEQLDETLQQAIATETSPIAQLRASCRCYGTFFETHPDYLEVFVLDRAEFRGSAPEPHLQHHEAMIQRYCSIVEAGIAAGEIQSVDPRQTVWSMGACLHGSIVHAAYVKSPLSLTESAVFTTDIFLRGICTPEHSWESKL